ncbi:recombinase family protein [Methylobacterium sp. B1]|uniref:recombinase family protein n=1 Tax=Methylobacterium sp. B1 TaxID=91459 RepID=UPI0003460078|nr:recombinase family protein [Methylobacterium sp. B1]
MTPDMLAYSYIRLSSAGQILGDGERRQFEDAKAYAERQGYTMAKPMKGLGVSAYRGKQRRSGSALGKFLEGLKSGKLENGLLIVEAVDRLSREPPSRSSRLITDILDAGTNIYLLAWGTLVTAENYDTTLHPQISLMQTLAYNESRQKSDRINAAIAERHKRAREGGRSKGAYHPSWLSRSYDDGEVKHLVIPEAAASIQRIYDLAAHGMGTRAIANLLNAEGARLPPADCNKLGKNVEREAGRRWHATYISQLLTSRAIIGEYQPVRTERTRGKGSEPDIVRTVPVGEPIPDYWPAVVTREQWDAVRASAHRKLGAKVGGRNMVFSNLLTAGLAKCAHCGQNMLIRQNDSRGKKQLYLRCANAQQGMSCDNTSYARYDWLEPKLLWALKGVPWGRLIRNIPIEDETAVVTAQIDEVATRIEALSRSSARLLRVIEDEDEPDAEILSRRREIQGEIANLKKRQAELVRDREALRRNAASNAGAVDEAVELARLMQEVMGAELYEIRQRIHTLLREIIEVAKLDMIAGVARVEIRGGMTLTIPLDKDAPPTAEFTGTFHDLVSPRSGASAPRLKPDEAKRRLVEAYDLESYSMVVDSTTAPWPRPAA